MDVKEPPKFGGSFVPASRALALVMRWLHLDDGALTLYTVGDAAEGPGHAVIRAEEILLSREPHPSSARNTFRGRVAEVASSGALTRVTVEVDGTPLVAALTTRSAEELALETGREVWASFKAMAVHLC